MSLLNDNRILQITSSPMGFECCEQTNSLNTSALCVISHANRTPTHTSNCIPMILSEKVESCLRFNFDFLDRCQRVYTDVIVIVSDRLTRGGPDKSIGIKRETTVPNNIAYTRLIARLNPLAIKNNNILQTKTKNNAFNILSRYTQ